jgi:hypothetical protein
LLRTQTIETSPEEVHLRNVGDTSHVGHHGWRSVRFTTMTGMFEGFKTTFVDPFVVLGFAFSAIVLFIYM